MMIFYLIGIVLLTMVFLGVVFLNPIQRRRWLRLWASLAVVLGMALLVIPFDNSSVISGNNHLLILTGGYQKDTVAAYNKSNAVKVSWENLDQSQIDQAAEIHVFGYGLPDTSVWNIPKSTTRFHASPLPTGIASIHWKQEISLGQGLLIQGSVSNPQQQKLQLQLVSGLLVIDQRNLGAQGSNRFEFNPSPKNLGTGNFQLLLLKGKDTLSKNPIPFIVQSPKPISVLLLQDAPSFEQKFLKNWLTDHGYELAARTRISKQIFDQAFSNRASANLLNINAGLLSSFDLLLTDEASLNNLSAMEQYQVRAAIREKGLGLLVTTDTILKHAALLDQALVLKNIQDSSSANRYLKMQGHDSTWHPMINKDAYLMMLPSAKMQTLVSDAKGRVLAGIYLEGMGKIGYSTLGQTHLWSLAGKQWDYDFYWTQLLESVASQTAIKESWTLGSGMDFIHHPVPIVQWKDLAQDSISLVSGSKIYLQQNAIYAFKQEGQFWPQQSGWQNLVTSGGQIKPWYVFDTKDWQLTQWSKNIVQTKTWLANSGDDKKSKTLEPLQPKRQYVPAIWAWLILLLGLAVLWIESKLE
ncbi:MAG: hypothetical protein CFE25_18090 [Chitinophagaceae bacterium BSSC1]|nr:MAG: hypothetical protein CFE25_18090 [Chitinophagaceae bacterium BSSC1]